MSDAKITYFTHEAKPAGLDSGLVGFTARLEPQGWHFVNHETCDTCNMSGPPHQPGGVFCDTLRSLYDWVLR